MRVEDPRWVIACVVACVAATTLAARIHTLDGLPLKKPANADEITELVNLGVEKVGAMEDVS